MRAHRPASEPWVALDLWDIRVVAKKLNERDLVPAFRRIRQIFADAIFYAKFAVLLQQEHERCRELLCQRASPELRIWIVGSVLFEVCLAVSLVEQNFIAANHEHRSHEDVAVGIGTGNLLNRLRRGASLTFCAAVISEFAPRQ